MKHPGGNPVEESSGRQSWKLCPEKQTPRLGKPRPLEVLTELAEEYLAALVVQGFSSDNTKTYRRYIQRFLEHVSTENRDIFCKERNTPDSVDHGCLLRWMQKIRLTGVKEYSLQANKTAVSSWYKWLIRLGRVERNPIDMLSSIKLPETDPKPLAPQETLRVLEGARELRWKYHERNIAILETFYASGIRCAELRDLDINDLVLDGETPYIVIRQGKGKRDGIGRLTPAAVDAIQTYLRVRAKLTKKFGRPNDWKPLFLSRSAARMDSWSIWSLVGRIGHEILGKHIHPHQFRHSFCTDLLNGGADLESIRKLARHKQLTTTQKYISVSMEHLRSAYAMHPRNRPLGRAREHPAGEKA